MMLNAALSNHLNESPAALSQHEMLAQREGKRRNIWPHQINSTFLNEGPSPRHRVKGKRTKCKHSKLKVRSSMKAPPPHKRSAGNKAAVKHKRTYIICLNESSQRTRATGRSQLHSCVWEKREESNTPANY